MVFSILQRYKIDFRTSIGWYINIKSAKEICFFIVNLSYINPTMLLLYFHCNILATTSASVFTVNLLFSFFYSDLLQYNMSRSVTLISICNNIQYVFT